MKNAQFVEVSKQLFEFLTPTEQRFQLKKYAQSQLKLKDKQLEDFIFVKENVLYKAADPYNDFFTWYYLHCGEMNNWDIKTYNPPIEKVSGLKIKPVRRYIEDNLLINEPCEPEDADFWSVYVVDANNFDVCIADCQNEPTAIALKKLIASLIHLSKVKILVNTENGIKPNILTNHPLEYIILDRTELISNPNSQLQVVKLDPHAESGQFSQSLAVHSEQDLYINSLLETLEF